MRIEIKNIEASIFARLKNIANESRRNFNTILLLYMQERFLYRLSISKYNEKFILKGGLLLFSMTEFKGRPTRDIDFLAESIPNEIENIKKAFIDICEIQDNDGIRYDTDSIKIERIKKDANYQALRVHIKSYLGNARENIQIDIGFGDIIIPKPMYSDYPVLLDSSVPRIKVSSVESIISEKFEAMITFSITNSRMKDFYDVYMLLETKDINGEILQTAIEETFFKRNSKILQNSIVFSEEFAKDKERNIQWSAFIRRIEVKNLDFIYVMGKIREFLLPVYKSLMLKDKYTRKWDSKNGLWHS